MKKYKVTETESYRWALVDKVYIVEANSKEEAREYVQNADFLLDSEISGRMPYKLRCGDLAAMSPVVGGFGLTLKGGIEYSLQNGPVIAAENFKLVGDLFAVGVKSYKGNWNIGDQVVIKQNDVVTAVGIAKMFPEEMLAMNRGVAVEVRHHA